MASGAQGYHAQLSMQLCKVVRDSLGHQVLGDAAMASLTAVPYRSSLFELLVVEGTRRYNNTQE